jgi:hypothetical protein
VFDTEMMLVSKTLVSRGGVPGAQAVDFSVALSSAYRKLHREGGWLRLDTPDESEVDRWFVETELDLLLVSGGTPQCEAALTVLDRVRTSWRAGQFEMSAADFYAWRFLPSLTVYELGRKRHPYPSVVAFDCDGVLYDFNDTLREWLVSHGWMRASLPDPTVYSLADAWGLHDEDLQREISSAVEAGALWNVGRPLMDGVAAAQDLGNRGHKVIINTARRIPGQEERSRAATMVWLRSHGVHPDGLHLADPRNPGDKNAVHFDILLDDHKANVLAALGANRSALLISRPWNAGARNVPCGGFADAVRMVERQCAPMPIA